MTVKIETKSGVFEFEPAPGESILFAGLAQGIMLPYECATGTCGTCRARVMSGTVDTRWDAAPGFSKLKRDKGDVLMCQSHVSVAHVSEANAPGSHANGGACVLRVPSEVRVADAPRPARLGGEIVAATRLTHDVMAFDVKLAAPMAFEAGQFVVVSVAGMAGGRAYSMVNYAPSSDLLKFVVKRKPGGGFSEWLFGADRSGARLDVFGALGRATFNPSEAHDLVIVAGGSGIAGMMSILDRATAAGHFTRHRGRVFFGVRTLADGFYLDELSRHAAQSGGAVEVTLVLSHETPPGPHHPAFPALKLGTGFVHEAAAAALDDGAPSSLLDRPEPALAFVAGPPPMVDGAIRSLLTAARIPSRLIRFDKFG